MMLCISSAYVVKWCLSVCPSIWVSVIFVYSVKMNKHIFNMFSPLGIQVPNVMAIFRWRLFWRGRRIKVG